jgi:hypothetical protein
MAAAAEPGVAGARRGGAWRGEVAYGRGWTEGGAGRGRRQVGAAAAHNAQEGGVVEQQGRPPACRVLYRRPHGRGSLQVREATEARTETAARKRAHGSPAAAVMGFLWRPAEGGLGPHPCVRASQPGLGGPRGRRWQRGGGQRGAVAGQCVAQAARPGVADVLRASARQGGEGPCWGVRC